MLNLSYNVYFLIIIRLKYISPCDFDLLWSALLDYTCKKCRKHKLFKFKSIYDNCKDTFLGKVPFIKITDILVTTTKAPNLKGYNMRNGK